MPVPEHELTRMWESRVNPAERDANVLESARAEILAREELSPGQRERIARAIGGSLKGTHENAAQGGRTAFEAWKKEIERSWKGKGGLRHTLLAVADENLARNLPHEGMPLTEFLRSKGNFHELSQGEKERLSRIVAKEAIKAGKPEEFKNHLEEHGGDERPLNWPAFKALLKGE